MSEYLNDDILVDYEQEPLCSSADLIIPKVPTLLNDLKTEDLDGEDYEKDSISNSVSGNRCVSSAVLLKQTSPSVAAEPQTTEVLEYEGHSGKANVPITRLVIVSWKVRQFSVLSKALKTGVSIVQYKSDSTMQSILSLARDLLKGQQVISLAFVSHGNPGILTVCTDKVLSAKTINGDTEVKQFFYDLVNEFIDQCNPNCHLDFLATSLVLSADGHAVIKNLQDYLRIPIMASKDILGTDHVRPENDIGNTGELYFIASTLRSWSGSVTQSISNYEKIRTIGRGAYGTAVLYRKKDDDSLVVLKEITILDLNATERQAAMNEVKVLGMLSHPNIVSYYDSFDEDGTLWIEMEYADGGTLSDYLSKQDHELEERDILIMFSQMVSAIKYCHDHNILHRDLKTQNIFLTQDFKVKLGDFGIAKIMNTNTGGNFSVVGTPYYISPEMCEGKRYDSKSDIWALGCVLYEMANLTRTFDGTNLPALINKIVKGTFAPVKEVYTTEFKLLVRDLLQKDPALRPSAEEILFNRLQGLLQRYDDMDDSEEDKSPLHYARTRSLLYFCDVGTMQLYPIQDLPSKILISEVSIGLGHVVAVSVERGVFTWGDNSYGQLAHGDLENKDHPTEVVLLRGKSVVRAFCGDYFSLFLSDNGLVLSCGQGTYGCLGHGDFESLTRPKLIDDLIMLDVAYLSAGSHHVAVCTGEGVAYTWGCGEDGRLGHGNEDNIWTPTKVPFRDERVFIRSVQCSENGTVFVADTGTVFACGRNYGNKLGLNPRQGFLLQFRSRSSKNIVEYAKVPTLVKDLCKYQLVDIKFGMSHFTIVNEAGKVYSNGNNNEAQLGCGNTKQHEAITMVKGLEEDNVTMVACGSTFSFAAVQDVVGKNTINSIYFWGTKPSLKRKRQLSVSESLAKQGMRSRGSSSYDEDSGISDPEFPRNSNSAHRESSGYLDARQSASSHSANSRVASGVDQRKSFSAISRKVVHENSKSGTPESLASSVFQDFVEKEIDDDRRSYLKSLFKGSNVQTLNLVPKENVPYVVPQLTFKFQTVGNIEGLDDDEEYPVVLQDIKCFQDHVIFHLETTAPPPKKRKVRDKLDSSLSSATSAKGGSSENSEADTSGEVPTWIRNELEYGIPLSGSENKSFDATKSKSSPNSAKPQRNLIKRRSLDSLNKRNTSTQKRDPNFNLIPKIQRQVTLLKLTEKEKSTEVVPLTETQIIDGVAVSKSIAEIQNSLISPTPSDQTMCEEKSVDTSNDVVSIETEEENDMIINDAHPPPLRTSLSPEIPISKIPKPKLKGKQDSTDLEITPGEIPEKKTSPTRTKLEVGKSAKERLIQQKGRLKRNMKAEVGGFKSKVLGSAKDKRSKDVDDRVSSASDVEDARERRRVKDRKKSEDKKTIEEAQLLAKVSEERLLEEIRGLKDEKDKREQDLKEMHEQQMKEREEKTRNQIEESKKREGMLKDEILGLKLDLNNQNSKLQDNYNILLSLQEQLLRMQQHQLRKTPDMGSKPGTPRSSSTTAISTRQQKSSICLLM